ncbi:HTH domain-containing protein [Natronococcus sp. A-GB7]|uniref:HTH domain-containing protein n=1 Tax=Natronococcus sp. A-GB7 TaxID=3037649 RepID=UPI00241E3CF9|nr:HTH domain-containing protein [Natronococcus sp. A-GB7]MDG5820248.1 HTH domain-containing protein [Natronococcus sp. A-GB7]
MHSELRVRRHTLWKRYILEGDTYSEVSTELADEYEVTEDTIRNDLTTIEEWLPKLYRAREVHEASALLALQENRHRLQQMAGEAREAEALDLELRIRKELTRTLNREEELTPEVDFTPEQDRMGALLEEMDQR